ncbi:OsmC family protein [Bacteroidota bacterium]
MKSTVKLDRNMRLIGTNPKGLETVFDTVQEVGGENTAATPMEIMLQSLAGCSAMDVLSILRKKRKQVDEFWIDIEGERADEHPKVFTKVHLVYNLKSPDAKEKDLIRSVELSQDKYCGASGMFKASGCEVTFETNLIKS